MSKPSGFEPVLSSKAIGFIYSLRKPKQRKLIDLIYRIAGVPSQIGDYESRDDTGREVQHIKIGDLIISFWADHAVKELRIVDIEEA
jgi:hypothetical protein